MRKWEFEEYRKNSTRQDSSSDKFFKDASESERLIREFVQNSLDARETSKSVKVIINESHLSKEFKKAFLDPLKLHLKASNILINSQNTRFIVLEDFNTKGLEKNNQEDFFYKDNITHKTEGGGSHGIGKAVFPDLSQMKTFFGYSIFLDENKKESVFQGRAVLKSHKIEQKEYRPYGDLKISVEENINFINEIFKRKKSQKGLSIAIPYCNINMKNIEKICLDQCYWPIVDKQLEVEIADIKLTQDTLLERNDSKIELANEYKTCPKNQIKTKTIKQKDWQELKFPELEKDLIEQQNRYIFISFKIELPVKGNSSEYGKINILIKKEENIQNQIIDFWRDHLLINRAFGGRKSEAEYSMIVIVKSDPLSKLLRQLEDPGHTKWQTGSIPEEVKRDYKPTLVKDLIKFIKRLPLEIIKQLKYQPIDQNAHFFADYFPDIPPKKDKAIKTKEGSLNSNGSGTIDEYHELLEPLSFPDFDYKKHKKGNGFTLKLKNKESYPEQITVRAAYGTNIGNAFKNYDKRDFEFQKDIEITVSDNQYGECLSCDNNFIQYKIKDKKFAISFTGFDADKELKIEVK